MKKQTIIFITAIILSIISLIFSVLWMYYLAFIIAIPSGILAYRLWRTLKRTSTNKIIYLIPFLLTIASIAFSITLILWCINHYTVDR